MNFKRFQTFLLCVSFSAGLLVSCEEAIETGTKIDESPYAAVYGNNAYLRDVQTNNAATIVELYGDTYRASVKMGLAKTLPKAVGGKLAVDAAYLDTWNKEHGTDYALYPASLVSLDGEGALKIAADTLFSSPVGITVTADTSVVAGKTYAIPLTVTVADPGVSVAETGHCVYLVRDMRTLPNCDKGADKPKGFLFFETGEANPLNALSFELENGKLLWDAVVLFSANINYNAVEGRPYVNCNQSTQDLLDNNEIYLQPLRKRGIKVFMCLLGNHDIAGLAQLSDVAARDFAIQVAEYCRRYNLDGIALDDEYSKSPDMSNPSFTTPGPAAGARLCYEIKRAMPEKLVAIYEWGFLYAKNFPDEVDGADVNEYIDIVVADYGKVATTSGDLKSNKGSGLSMEFNRGTGGSLDRIRANSLISGGYGWFMGFAALPDRYQSIFNRLRGGPEVLYGSAVKKPTVFYKKGDPKPYVFPDDLYK